MGGYLVTITGGDHIAKKKGKKRYGKKKGKIDTDAIINGFAAEIGPSLISNFVGPDLASPVTHGLIAYFRKDSHAAFTAGRELAQLLGRGGLGGILGGIGGGNGGGNNDGFFEV